MSARRQGHRIQLEFDDTFFALLKDVEQRLPAASHHEALRAGLIALRDRLDGEKEDREVMRALKILIADVQLLGERVSQLRADFNAALEDEAT